MNVILPRPEEFPRMVFNSIAFLVFFALFFHLYWWINKRGSVGFRNLFLIAASYLFYGWWDWRFLGLIIISSAADFILGLQIYQSGHPHRRKWLLVLSLLINLGILGFFKYFNFFTDSLASLLAQFSIEVPRHSLQIILPVGISFYTFQTMSYTIDIYRGQLEPTRSWRQFFAFVSFFPQLVAGPIERARRFMPQFETRRVFSRSQATAGLRLVLWGFFKKIVIADNLAFFVEEIFDHPGAYPGIGILIGAMAFAFQIYCDFSGYSDIAIGLGKSMGFELMTNFRKPYFSHSFTEFWKRWHISLSTWFRDYVYIPLGGNRVRPLRHSYNLMLTFLLSGLWHGANFTFLIWGAAHGSMLVLEKKFKAVRRMPAFLVFLVTCLFWLPFRAESMEHLQVLLQELAKLNLDINWQGLAIYDVNRLWGFGFVFLLFLLAEWGMGSLDFYEAMDRMKKPLRIATYYCLLAAILLLGNFDVKPFFIYFQF